MSYPWNQRGQDTHHHHHHNIWRDPRERDDQPQRRPPAPAREQRNSSYAQASGSGTSFNSRISALDYFPPNGGPSGTRVAPSLATPSRFDGQYDESEQASMTLTEEWVTNERRMQHYRMNGYHDLDGDVDSEASTGSRTLFPTLSMCTLYMLLAVPTVHLTKPFCQDHKYTIRPRRFPSIDAQLRVSITKDSQLLQQSQSGDIEVHPLPLAHPRARRLAQSRPPLPSASQQNKYTMHVSQRNYTRLLLHLLSQNGPSPRFTPFGNLHGVKSKGHLSHLVHYEKQFYAPGSACCASARSAISTTSTASFPSSFLGSVKYIGTTDSLSHVMRHMSSQSLSTLSSSRSRLQTTGWVTSIT